jgi:hypothetical protein
VLLGFKLPEAAADGLQQVAFAARTDMDSQRETDAALRIQSYYRGFRCRKTVNGSHTDVCTQATCTGDKLRRRAARIQETLLVCCFPFNMGKHCEDHLDRLRRWTWAGSTYQLLCRRPSVHVGILKVLTGPPSYKHGNVGSRLRWSFRNTAEAGKHEWHQIPYFTGPSEYRCSIAQVDVII